MTYEDVHDRASFVAYLASLRTTLAEGPSETKWPNSDLPSFLRAMESWAEDWNKPFQANPWRHAADLITAATIYE